ncbi:MAG: hypothetical protein AAGA18_09150 [Verrucomicrobiota bacterium]
MTEKIIEGLKASIERSIDQLAETKDIQDRKTISETIENLSDTLIAYLDSMNPLNGLGDIYDDDEFLQ